MDTKVIRNNKILSVIAAALRTAAYLCSTGVLMQTFLTTLGFSGAQVYIHSTVLQAANVLTILLGARFADRGNVFRRAAFSVVVSGALYLGYIPLCVTRSTGVWSFVLLLGVSVAQAIMTALHTVCEYKIPYFVYKPEEYGGIMAICGILSSVISFAIGALVTALTTKIDYVVLMFGAFVISAAIMAAASFLQLKLRSLVDMTAVQEDAAALKKTRVPLWEVFRHPAFSQLCVAHLFRGFAGGVVNVLAVVAAELAFNETVTSAMVSVQSVAMLVGCALYGVSAKHIRPRFVIFAGSVCVLLLPILLISKNSILFLALYAVIFFGRTLVDYAVPSAMLYAVPVRIAGPYNAWRMVLNNGGMLLATAVGAIVPSSAWLLWIAFACSAVSGIFYLFARVMRKNSVDVSGV